MRKLAVASLIALAAGCGKDSTFSDAAPPIDAREVDGGGDEPGLNVPTSLDLGELACGTDAGGGFSIENVGGVDLSYALVSSNPIFAVSPTEGTVAAGAEADFTIAVAVPAGAAAGVALTGELTITTGVLDPVVIGLSVTPRGGALEIEPSPVSFGDVEVGLSATQQVTFRNTGNQPISVDFVEAEDAFDLDLASTDLAIDAEATGTITYTPTAIADDAGSIGVAITGVTCGAQPTSLALSGSGAPDGGVLVTGSLGFGSQACTSAVADTRSVTLTNDGNVAATFSAALLADGEGDHLRYTVSPDSGSIPVGESRTVTVTRVPPALPFQPRAVDAVLRITTVGQLTEAHDLPVTQAIDGPFLEANLASIDYGFAPPGETLSRTVTITNAGTAGTALTYTETGAHFSVPQSGASIGPGPAQVSFTATYAPSATGVTTGSVAIAATPGSCSGPTSLALAAGTGPWAQLGAGSVSSNCSDLFPVGTTYTIPVNNLGNQTLTLAGCAEDVATDIDPVISPDPASIGAGTGADLTFDWQPPEPLRSGVTTTTLTCNTNEKFFEQRTLTITRAINGADLTVEAADGDFAFTCSTPIFAEKHLRIVNDGNRDAFLIPESSLPTPLYRTGSSFTVGSGGDESSAVGVGMGSGSCAPGSGYVGVFTGSANVCSVTPSNRMNVTLTD